MIELIRSTGQFCRMKFPGTIRILTATERIRINTWCKSETVKSQPAWNKGIHLYWCSTHLCGVCTGGNITDHKPTAPPLGCVGIAGMDEESIVNLLIQILINSPCIVLKPIHNPAMFNKKQINSQTSARLTEGKAQLRQPEPAPLGSPDWLTACFQGGWLGDGTTCQRSGYLQGMKTERSTLWRKLLIVLFNSHMNQRAFLQSLVGVK